MCFRTENLEIKMKQWIEEVGEGQKGQFEF